MKQRAFASEQYNSVKTAFKLLVQQLGGIDAAASCTRVGRSQISEYGLTASDKTVPADVIMDLEAIAGVPMVTAALARAQGYGLVMIEPKRARGELAVLLARIGQDAGELFATAASALAHKRPTPAERQALLRELDDLRRTADEAMIFLNAGDEPA